MQESHTEGLATHGDPESCIVARKSGGEALTGENVGRVSSRENFHPRADALMLCGRPQHPDENGELGMSSARSKTPSMRGHSMRENRESLVLPERDGRTGRTGKAGAARR
jgi:hypothetical protein